jgi:hypothetical protein
MDNFEVSKNKGSSNIELSRQNDTGIYFFSIEPIIYYEYISSEQKAN